MLRFLFAKLIFLDTLPVWEKMEIFGFVRLVGFVGFNRSDVYEMDGVCVKRSWGVLYFQVRFKRTETFLLFPFLF